MQALSVEDLSKDERCRYCFGTAEGWVTPEPLISPCSCRGSLAFVHKSCLEKWLNIKGIERCDLCNYLFPTIQVYKSITEWEFSEIPIQEIFLIIFGILMYATFILQLMGAVYVGLAPSCFKLAQLSISLVAYTLGLLWFLIGCICVTAFIYTSEYWCDWRRRNQRKIVLLDLTQHEKNKEIANNDEKSSRADSGCNA